MNRKLLAVMLAGAVIIPAARADDDPPLALARDGFFSDEEILEKLRTRVGPKAVEEFKTFIANVRATIRGEDPDADADDDDEDGSDGNATRPKSPHRRLPPPA